MKVKIVHPAFRPLSRGDLVLLGTAILLYGTCVLLVLFSPFPKAQLAGVILFWPATVLLGTAWIRRANRMRNRI